MEFCDSCMTVAYDKVGEDVDAQEHLLATAPEVLDDHLCDRVEEPDLPIRCDCSEHRTSADRQQINDAAMENAQERAYEDNEARRIGLI